MPLYLTPYIGSGTKADPFRPRGSDQAGWSAIDLRADKGVTLDGGGFGYALLHLPVGSSNPVGAVKIADDKLDTLSPATRNFVQNRTGLDLSLDVTVQDLIESLLVRPPVGWWNPVKPVNGRVEVWLNRERVVDFPVLAGGAITDNFNRANETPLAAPWARLTGSTGNINLSSNALVTSAAGDKYYSYTNAAGWSADQSSQITLASGAGTEDCGVAVRVGSSGFSGYFLSLFAGGGSLGKHVSGTYTNLESAAFATGNGSTYKLDVAGSTLRYYEDGVEDANSPGTDTSLTTAGDGPGLFFYDGGTLDDWIGTGELSAVSVSASPEMYRHRSIH